jgi:hypothetical protein
MSDINDCSYNESKVTLCDNDDNDDYINPITGYLAMIYLMINRDKIMVSLN